MANLLNSTTEMKSITIIGDVHGKLDKYFDIVNRCENSICVGDFGFKEEWDWHRDLIGYPHWINPGNHDWNGAYQSIEINGEYLSTGNFRSFSKSGIFTIRGAKSIDKYLREDGKDWFPNEELTYRESLEAFDAYCKSKPRIVISHDCPSSIAEEFFGITEKTGTRQTLQAMFEEHQPNWWFFGHHHKSRDEVIGGTRFICLNELETKVIEV